jgi:peroxiredoxin
MTLPVGTKAPDFTLPTTPDQKVSLSDFKGRNVILAFYPADWSPVCGDQLAVGRRFAGSMRLDRFA